MFTLLCILSTPQDETKYAQKKYTLVLNDSLCNQGKNELSTIYSAAFNRRFTAH